MEEQRAAAAQAHARAQELEDRASAAAADAQECERLRLELDTVSHERGQALERQRVAEAATRDAQHEADRLQEEVGPAHPLHPAPPCTPPPPLCPCRVCSPPSRLRAAFAWPCQHPSADACCLARQWVSHACGAWQQLAVGCSRGGLVRMLRAVANEPALVASVAARGLLWPLHVGRTGRRRGICRCGG